MGIVVVVNYLCEYLQKSGAFEVYFNGIWLGVSVNRRQAGEQQAG